MANQLQQPEIVAAAELFKVIHATQVGIAAEKQRKLPEVEIRCIEEAKLAGESVYYSWEQKVQLTDRRTGQKFEKATTIEDLSIGGAMIVIRNLGNVKLSMMPIGETRDSWIITPIFYDLETNFSMDRPFRMSKTWMVHGNMDEGRKMDIRFNIGVSKATRNLVRKCINDGLAFAMIEAAKGSVQGKIMERIKKIDTDNEKAKKQNPSKEFKAGFWVVTDDMLSKFLLYAVEKEQLEKKVDRKVEHWTIETLVILSADLFALKSGAATPDSLYGDLNDDATEGAAVHATQVETTPTSDPVEGMKAGDAKNHQGHERPAKAVVAAQLKAVSKTMTIEQARALNFSDEVIAALQATGVIAPSVQTEPEQITAVDPVVKVSDPQEPAETVAFKVKLPEGFVEGKGTRGDIVTICQLNNVGGGALNRFLMSEMNIASFDAVKKDDAAHVVATIIKALREGKIGGGE